MTRRFREQDYQSLTDAWSRIASANVSFGPVERPHLTGKQAGVIMLSVPFALAIKVTAAPALEMQAAG